MYNPKISIIIPVYNRQKTIGYCIESVLAQEYGNWELLLVDDGSTDRTAEICKQYGEQDQRIHYLRQANSGVSVARNNGIDHATGEWVTFVDSDDAITPAHLCLVPKMGEGRDLLMTNRTDYDDVQEVSLTGNKAIVAYLFGGGTSTRINIPFTPAGTSSTNEASWMRNTSASARTSRLVKTSCL